MLFFLTNPGIVFRKLWLVALRGYRALAALGSEAVMGESIRESPAVRFVSCTRVHHTQQSKIPGTTSSTDTPLSELYLHYLCLEPIVSRTVGVGGSIKVKSLTPNKFPPVECRFFAGSVSIFVLSEGCFPVAVLSHLILK